MNLIFVWIGAAIGFAVGVGLSSALGLAEAGWALITALAGLGWLAWHYSPLPNATESASMPANTGWGRENR